MKKILIISILAISQLNIKAQDKNLDQLEKSAFIAYTNSNITMWKQIAQEADKLLANHNSNATKQIAAIKLKYGFLNGCLANQDKITYEQNIDKILEQIDTLLKTHPESSDLYAISASVMGVQMAFNPIKGAKLGAQSSKYTDKALKLDSLNANAWRQYASSKYFTPKMWGGDLNEAISGFKLAIILYERNEQTRNWLYVDSMVWLGIAYEKNGEPEKAKKMYEQVLEIAPEFGWVKYQLLPNLKKS